MWKTWKFDVANDMMFYSNQAKEMVIVISSVL